MPGRWKFWSFSFEDDAIRVVTPWFGFAASTGSKDFCNVNYWWGFEFWWKWNKKLKLGDLCYLKCFKKTFLIYPEWKRRKTGGLP